MSKVLNPTKTGTKGSSSPKRYLQGKVLQPATQQKHTKRPRRNSSYHPQRATNYHYRLPAAGHVLSASFLPPLVSTTSAPPLETGPTCLGHWGILRWLNRVPSRNHDKNTKNKVKNQKENPDLEKTYPKNNEIPKIPPRTKAKSQKGIIIENSQTKLQPCNNGMKVLLGPPVRVLFSWFHVPQKHHLNPKTRPAGGWCWYETKIQKNAKIQKTQIQKKKKTSQKTKIPN